MSKKLIAFLSILSLTLSLPLMPVNAAVKAGATCKTAGTTSVATGKTYTCIKSGKKLVWKISRKNHESSLPQITEKSVFDNVSKCMVKTKLIDEANMGFPISSIYLKSTGIVNLAVIYTTYTDAPGDDRAFKEYSEVQFPNAAKFYSNSSYGKLGLTLTTNNKYYNIPKSSASYNLEAMNQTSNFAGVAEDAVNAAKNDYDFSKIDAIFIVMPSTSKAVDLGAFGTNIQLGNKGFYQAMNGAFINPSTKVRVHERYLTHEIGHNFGLIHPLLQDRGYALSVMHWEQSPVSDLFGWEKFLLNWIELDQVDCLAVIPTSKITSYVEGTGIKSLNKKLMVIKISEHKLLVIESRRKSELDDLTQKEEGLLLYKVDLDLGSDKGTVELITNGSPIKNFNGQTLLVGTFQEGESISVDGIQVKVLKQGVMGDFFSVNKVQ